VSSGPAAKSATSGSTPNKSTATSGNTAG
jgi:hypothetical protein